jgi:DNA-binding winged helix-turn-helix (wHTH) protein
MIFRFDRYTLNSETRTLSCRGSAVPLTPKVFRTLLVLVENHARVMSKDELFQHIWPRQSVEEANLTQNISILRKALEEAANGKRFIATFHGHGYRFVEPVEIVAGQDRLGGKDTPSAPESDRLEAMEAAVAPRTIRLQGRSPQHSLLGVALCRCCPDAKRIPDLASFHTARMQASAFSCFPCR